jgi:geranylgeranyl pyrophosphate synthase
MNSEEHRKKSEIVLEMLVRRAEKALEFARKTVLADDDVSGELHEILEYYTSSWENFTHPGLFSIACEAVGGNPAAQVEIQAGIVMISAALDVHDDIIDRSKAKHGKPTVFGKYGQTSTLILGDVFFVSGFTLLGKTLARLPDEKMKEIFAVLRRTLFELGRAHALESHLKAGMQVTPERCMRILQMKAASVESDMRIGAIIGGGTKSEIEALTRYGRIAGVLATLREEFIDIFEIEELCHRIRSEYLPVPVLYAIQDEESKGTVEKLISKRKMTSADVDELVDTVLEAKSVGRLKKKMGELVAESFCLASKVKNQKSRNYLRNITSSTLEDL